MKKYAKRPLAIIMSIMIVMLYMVPGSVFAESKAASGDVYQLVDAIGEGEYLIVNSNSSGSHKAVKNPGGTSGGASMGAETVTVEDVDSVPSIVDPADDIIWQAEANGNGVTLKNGTDYLEGKSGRVRIYSSQQYPERYWTYSGHTLKFNDSYSLYYSDSSFTGSTSSSGNVYIYKKAETGPAAVTGVTLDKTKLTLKAGSTAQLKATVAPSNASNKKVEWSTDDEDVATVESGTVTAVGNGTATITATTEEGGFTATCQVTVKESALEKYVLTDAPEEGKEYLIVSTNEAGSAYALTNPGGTSSGAAMESTPVTILEKAGDVEDRYISVDTEDTSVVWMVTSDSGGLFLSNDTDYLEGKGGDVKIFDSIQYADRGWEYTDGQLKHKGGQNTYVVYYDNGFKATYDETSEKVYFFEKYTGGQNVDPVPSGGAVNVGVTSDVHGNVSGLEDWMRAVQRDYDPDLDSMLYCGDYSYKMNDLDAFVAEFKQIVQVTNDVIGKDKGIYTSGNHEYYINSHEIPLDERFTSTQGFVRLGEALVKDNYRVFCMGAASWGNNAVGDYPQSDIDALAEYLDSAPSDIPILIPAHFPLHFVSGRTVNNADKVIEVLNEHPNAIFFWGHNHSQRDPHYGQIIKPGGTIEYASGKSSEINFTYACAGGMYQDSQTNYSGVVLSISPEGDEVTFQYYRASTGAPIGDSTTLEIEGTNTEKHTITASAGTGGSIAPDGDVQVAEGKSKTFGFTPDAGYEIDKVTVDGEEVTVEGSSYTFSNVTENHTIDVTFKEADVTEYVLTDSVKNNKSYLIVSNGYALLNDNGVIGKIPVQVSDDGKTAYINTGDTQKDIFWTLHDSDTSQTSGDYTIENNGYKLSRVSQGADNPSEITTEEKFSETSGLPYFQWSYDAENEQLINLGGQNGDTAFYFLFNTSESKFYTSTTEGKTGLFVPAGAIEWSEPEYEWSDDNSECTATRTGSDGSVEEETKASEVVTEPATCEAAGKKTYTVTFENEAFKTQTKEETLDATGHDWDTENIKWTWTSAGEDGYTATAEFTCNNDESHKKVLEAVVSSDTTEPTFEASGKTVYNAAVTLNGKVYRTGEADAKTIVIPALEYEWAEPEYEWADDNNSVTATCKSTNAPDHQVTEIVDTTSRVTQPATCETAGKKTYTADFEHAIFETQTKEVVIPALGHKYGLTEFEWADDLSTAVAVFTCEHDSTHVRRVDAEVTPFITPPTCTMPGTKACIAVVDALSSPDGKRHTAGESIEIPAKGHAYENFSWTWQPDYSGATLTMRCPVCGDLRLVDGTVTSRVTEPTCTTEGKRSYTARAVFEGSEYIYTKEITIPALGHDWDEGVVKTEPTCTEKGTMEYTCKNDPGHKKTEAIDALGHKAAAPVKENVVAATCVKAGSYDEVIYCKTCGEELERTHKTIPALGHDWGAWKVTKKATTTAEGEETRICRNDPSHKQTRKIPKKADPLKQMGTDGTAVGRGASAQAAEKALVTVKGEKDPKGAKFGLLKLKSVKQTKTSVTITWSKVKGAQQYVIYGSKCGKTMKKVKLATVTGNSKTFTTIAGKKVRKGTYYKFIVVALDKNNKVVTTSKVVHAATKGGKAGNPKGVKVSKSVISKAAHLKKGKSLALKATQMAASGNHKVESHTALRYESSDTKVATVSGKGVVKGVSKGKCSIYIYAQNGIAKAVKVTVK